MKKTPLKLLNTFTKEKEAVYPQNGEFITLYTCGPTVYNFAHIGNLRTYVFEDLLRRAIEYFGFQVRHVMNITDLDDKTIECSREKNISLREFVAPFIKAFFEDRDSLQILPAHEYPKATDYIEKMLQIIEVLLQKGFAYIGKDKSVYFRIHNFSSYGQLSHLDLSSLKKGASGIPQDEYQKEHASDFVLWKSYEEKRDGSVFWESPYGRGRPGWHIECSAMAISLLGKSIDIHCGGVDNIFPHHENEIAQSECYTGQKFARVWLHSEHLLVDGKKMSKSLGNFYTLRDLLARGYTPLQIRYMLMQTHYRMQLNFTFQEIDAVCMSLQRITDFIARLQRLPEKASSYPIEKILQESQQKFVQSLADDLNISGALASLFELIKSSHLLIDENKIGSNEGQKILHLLRDWNKIFAFLPLSKQISHPSEVEELAKEREEARRKKDFALADKLREKIIALGYTIEDLPSGFYIKKSVK